MASSMVRKCQNRMMTKFSFLLALLLGAIGLPVAHAQVGNAQQIADAVDRHYNDLQSLQTQFTESYRGAGLQRQESGTLWLKKPGKMRWEYASPREKLFISDGKIAWFYVPGESRVQKAPVSKIDDLRSPLRFLLGKTKLDKELNGLSIAPDVTATNAGNVVLRGVPRQMQDRISQVLLEITPDHRIARMLIDEIDGSVTEFQFSDQRENVNVNEHRFRFSPPPGVEVVDAQDLGD
jgi:outer membrane lipoprotein carrier protein